MAEQLESDFPHGSEPPQEDQDGPLSVKPRYTNALSAIELLTGVLIFLGSWGAKRFLDEIYDVRIRPRFRAMLGEKLQPIVQPPADVPAPRKHYCLVLGLWHPVLAKAVLVAAVGEDSGELLRNEQVIKAVHLSAERELVGMSANDSILLYVLREHVPTGGLHFSRLEDALAHLALPTIQKPPEP